MIIMIIMIIMIMIIMIIIIIRRIQESTGGRGAGGSAAAGLSEPFVAAAAPPSAPPPFTGFVDYLLRQELYRRKLLLTNENTAQRGKYETNIGSLNINDENPEGNAKTNQAEADKTNKLIFDFTRKSKDDKENIEEHAKESKHDEPK